MSAIYRCRYCRGNESEAFLPADKDCNIDLNLPFELAYDLSISILFFAGSLPLHHFLRG